MKTFLSILLFVSISSIEAVAQNVAPMNNLSNLKEGAKQRVILQPTPTENQKNKDQALMPTPLENPLPAIGIEVPFNANISQINIAIPGRRFPTLEMNMNAMYQSERKDPQLSSTLSMFLPGVGQLYNGQTTKAIAFMGATFGGIAVGATALANHQTALSTVGFLTAGLSYLWSILDAGMTSNKTNHGHGLIDIALNQKRHIAINPAITTLQNTKGEAINQTTNSGVSIAYLFGD
ncbi:MAG: hypothetical protein ACP5F6_00575 [Microbacter sp.]